MVRRGQDAITASVVSHRGGEVAPSDQLRMDLPDITAALKPLLGATHVLVANLAEAEIPASFEPFLGHYGPGNEVRHGCRVFERIFQSPKYLVSASLNGYSGVRC